MARGTELTMSMIVFAVLALIVIIVVASIFIGKTGDVSNIFGEKTQEAQKESSKISVFNGCCGGDCKEGREPVNGICKSSCENSYTEPLNGWDDCKGNTPVCCKNG